MVEPQFDPPAEEADADDIATDLARRFDSASLSKSSVQGFRV
jgi:hypothetical protein